MTADWTKPSTSSSKVNFPAEIINLAKSAVMLDPHLDTNIPTSALYYNRSTGRLQQWSGAAWVDQPLINPFDTGPRNKIIGGNFDTNPWQRGTTFAAVNSYCADRFKVAKGGAVTGVMSATKTADAPSVASAGLLVQNCLDVQCTTAQGSIGSADEAFIETVVEGYNFLPLAQQSAVISFWVKSSVTGSYGCWVTNSGGDRSFAASFSVSVANTWEQKTIVIPASPSAGTWDYANGIGLRLRIYLVAGSTLVGTLTGAWVSAATPRAASAQVNFMSANTNHFKLALVQLEAGSIATPFESRRFAEELQLCKRYYEKSFSQGVNPAQAVGSYNGASFIQLCNGAGTGMMFTRFGVEKRAVPTMTTYNPINSNAQAYDSTKSLDCSGTSTDLIGTGGFRIFMTPPGTGANGDHVACHWGADAEL